MLNGEILDDEAIMNFDAKQLISAETFDALYDIEDEVTRARLIGLITIRAKDLKVGAAVREVLKAYESENRKLSADYAKMNAEQSAEIPLLLNSYGMPKNETENFLRILKNDPIFEKIRFNEMSASPEIYDGKTSRQWDDTDDSETRAYIEKRYHIYNEKKLNDALRILFKERKYHPAKQLIESTKWDGIERIPTFLIKWMGCEDSKYTREVSRLIFAGGIHRIYHPGCKFDEVPVLIGTNQGEGKSTIVRWLAMEDQYFTEVTTIEGQKGAEAIEGIWICEIAELLAVTRAKELEAVKSYMTTQSDRYRKPFAKNPASYPRQCIFIGTTNKEQFLTDKTGNRRFYPIKVHQVAHYLRDHEREVRNDIAQCWAEALVKLKKGEMQPCANRKLIDEIKKQQEAAMEDDYREGIIFQYLSSKDETCVIDIWEHTIGDQFHKPTRKESNDITLILQSSGVWERAGQSKTQNYGNQRIWRRKTDPTGLKELSRKETGDVFA